MIPTAEEVLEKYEKEFKHNGIVFDLKKPMIEFAKLHVEAALKRAHMNMQLPFEDLEFTLESYPLSNIK